MGKAPNKYRSGLFSGVVASADLADAYIAEANLTNANPANAISMMLILPSHI
jgi:hypothetical protein